MVAAALREKPSAQQTQTGPPRAARRWPSIAAAARRSRCEGGTTRSSSGTQRAPAASRGTCNSALRLTSRGRPAACHSAGVGRRPSQSPGTTSAAGGRPRVHSRALSAAPSR